MSTITRCLICNESSESNVCDDCSSKKRCKVCNEMKMDFYSYKNGKVYSTCRECFNKKVRCEFCNKELNRSYLRSHIKKQHLYPRVPTQGLSHRLARVPAQGYPWVPHRGIRRAIHKAIRVASRRFPHILGVTCFSCRFPCRFPHIIIIMIISVIEHY